jgi:acrylyl-CoA reductase (NADPH)
MPFILRGVTLLGIDSVYCPMAQRRIAWQRLAGQLPATVRAMLGNEIGLDQVPAMAAKLLDGKQRGRLVVSVG